MVWMVGGGQWIGLPLEVKAGIVQVSGGFDLEGKGSETRLQPEGAAGAGQGGSQERTDRLLFPR